VEERSVPVRRIASLQGLLDCQEALRREAAGVRKRILVCMTGCRALGAQAVFEAFRKEIEAAGLADSVQVVGTGCHGPCAMAPVAAVEPPGFFYGGLKPEDVPEIVRKSVMGDRPVERLCARTDAAVHAVTDDVPFFKAQDRRVLADCGRVDPRRIEDSIVRGRYQAAAKALCGMTPEQVIDEVRESGLRGRGGAGFPTGVKWGFCRQAPGDEKYLICNADEGDPGAFMDRALLEGDPHRVIEGMLIAAWAIGARRGVVYVRAEYPIAVEHAGIAVAQAREAGLLGRNILGTGFDFDVEIREGAGAFVCGEETALIASLEGRRGMPRPRPPFPAASGYLGKPTNINNVETFANVPDIIRLGHAWYSAVGTERSKGTKIFALAGKVKNTGLVEVPMGATLREIIYEIGGGIPGNRAFKAAQMGGPSGGCVPPSCLDMPIDYDSVQKIGAIMGSGGLIVMDENTCMVDIARFFLDFVQKESCGKCVPCRVGTRHMLDILTRITRGEGRMEDLDRLEDLAKKVKAGSLCGLGQTAPNPVLSTLRYFRDEYVEHIRLKKCRASTCEALVEAPCAHACPAGVQVPQYLGLIAEGRLDEAVDVIRRRNPFVSVCGRVCDHPCEARCRRSDVDEPLAIRALKRYAADHAAGGGPLAAPAQGAAAVAVVGAGPAGLSCAYFLALMGRRSVVFEALPVAGGQLAVGIPEYRLPKSILQRDIDYIVSHGVEVRTGVRVEEVESLRRDYRAVFLATGAHRGREMRIEGEDLDGVVDSLVFLRQRALGGPVRCGRVVAVIGGGNAAIDAARSAMRLGAAKVMVLYRRTREEMPAYAEEIEAALHEGVELHELVAPRRVLGENGRVAGLEMTRMRLGAADETGRRRPEPAEGTEFVVPCDMVVPAIGQRASVEAGKSLGLRVSEWGTIMADDVTLETSVAGVFAGGDCVNGGETVIAAIGHGQRAASAIDRMLGGAGRLPPGAGMSLRRPSEEELTASRPREREPELAAAERIRDFREVVGCMSPAAAGREACRCLRCDLERTWR